MKYLFIVQGEGREHFIQAMSIGNILEQAGHEVVKVMVGTSARRKVPEFFRNGVSAPVEEFRSLNFLNSSRTNRPHLVKKVSYTVFIFAKYFPSIRRIRRGILGSGADVVLNFYEFLVGLTYMWPGLRVPQVSIGREYMYMRRDFRFPSLRPYGREWMDFISRRGSFGASKRLALSFYPLAEDVRRKVRTVPPPLRPEVLALRGEFERAEAGGSGAGVRRGDYILGFMLDDSFDDEVLRWHEGHPNVPMHFFWDKWSAGKVRKYDENMYFHLFDGGKFIKYMAGCRAYAGTAGFESMSEAMYLGKPVLAVPTNAGQKIDAFDAARIGRAITAESFDLSTLMDFSEKFVPDSEFAAWVASSGKVILSELTDVSRRRRRRRSTSSSVTSLPDGCSPAQAAEKRAGE